jgi:hypothetical protein
MKSQSDQNDILLRKTSWFIQMFWAFYFGASSGSEQLTVIELFQKIPEKIKFKLIRMLNPQYIHVHQVFIN